MSSGKAEGQLGEPLKGADKILSRLKAAELRSFPLSEGILQWYSNFAFFVTAA